MAELKTFLFTDIVGSVELKGEMPGRSDAERDQAYIELVLTPHQERIERELAALGGRVVSTAGDGHFLVFSDTISAARWAIGLQQSHTKKGSELFSRKVADSVEVPEKENSSDPFFVAVRVSMHLGIPQVDPRDPNNFVGKPVDYASRLNDYATGGQILVSRSVVAVLEDAGMDGVTFHRHGRRELRGIGEVDVYELVYDATGPKRMRHEPRESLSRQWTVLPATVGLTQFHAGVGEPSGAADRPRTTSAPPWVGKASLPERSKAPSTAESDDRRLGNYLLEELLGSGGMGDVYRARHSQFGRVRAVKVIKQHFIDAEHREVIRRFYQEIKAVGALEHPNIVVAIDSSSPSDAVHYLVMEYIDGVGADELVARNGPLPVAEACEIARQATRGLAYIHQHGMVHRDIKPSNLMVTLVRKDIAVGLSDAGPKTAGEKADLAEAGYKDDEQAVVKILDLGLALLVGDDQQRLTLYDNRAMGTAMYMSPEQWKTTSVDIRADIYSLGCTLYHLLAGKPPFWESDLRPEKAHEREKLPPLPSVRELPPELWGVLEKMTAKSPEERYTNPTDLLAALAPFAEGHQLAHLARRAMGRLRRAPTEGFAKGETIVAKSAESDTQLGGRRPGWSLSKSLAPSSRRRLWRALVGVGIVAAMGAFGWLALRESGRRESLEASRQQVLKVAADSAANKIRNEIDRRFQILQQEARGAPLQETMVRIDSDPENQALWEPLRGWIAAWKVEGDQRVPSESWFITDRRGTQVSRSPWSESVGHNYSFRDYFHGVGHDLEQGTPDVTPIQSPHLSAVYQSTSDRTLRVAFSVPIDNGRSGTSRQVVGVLAMSVDLGEFNVLENVLDRAAGQEVVLVDMRDDYVDGAGQRGLVLHHHRGESFRAGERPPRLSAAMLARIEEALSAQGRTAGANRAGGKVLPEKFLGEYADPLSDDSGQKYWGAVEPVILTQPGGEPWDTGWLVLVQEPVRR